jgi:hypothetical protein
MTANVALLVQLGILVSALKMLVDSLLVGFRRKAATACLAVYVIFIIIHGLNPA